MKQFFKFSVSNIQIRFSKGDSVLSKVFLLWKFFQTERTVLQVINLNSGTAHFTEEEYQQLRRENFQNFKLMYANC